MIVEDFTGGIDASQQEIVWIKWIKANLWVALDLSGTFAQQLLRKENVLVQKNVSDYDDLEVPEYQKKASEV